MQRSLPRMPRSPNRWALRKAASGRRGRAVSINCFVYCRIDAHVFCDRTTALLLWKPARVSETMKTPFQHIPFAKLADLAEDKLPANERTESLDHVASCSRCGSELQRLGSLIAAMRTDTSEDAPRDVIAHALNIFRQRETQPSLLRRIVAALSFDSRALT